MQKYLQAFPGRTDIFWNEWKLNPNSRAYNISLAYEIAGKIDISRLKQSIFSLIDRHDIFRIYFSEHEDGVQAHLADESMPCIDVVDLSNNQQADAVQLEIDKVRQHHFDLEKPLLFKISLIKKNDHCHFLALCFHHVILDGLSEVFLINHIANHYRHHDISAESFADSCPRLSINEYTEAKNTLIGEQQALFCSEFWQQQIEKISVESNDFSKIQSTQRQHSKVGQYRYFKFDSALTRLFEPFLKDRQSSRFSLIAAVYLLVLHRLSDSKQLTACYAVNCRPKALRQTLGCFINILPISILFEEGFTFSSLLEAVTQQRLQHKAHQHYPFLEIVSKIREKKHFDVHTALNVGLIQTHIKTTAPELGYDIGVCPVIEHDNEVIYDICLEYEFIDDTLACRLNYRKDYFDQAVIDNFFNYFEKALALFIKAPEKSIYDFYLPCGEQERQLLNDWNNTAIKFSTNRSLPRLFLQQADESPSNTALIYQHQVISYKGLSAKSGMIASFLAKNRQGSHFIPVVLGQGIDRITAMLAVMQAGLAYVPIDPDYPVERIVTIVEDCQARLVISNAACREKIRQTLSAISKTEILPLIIEDLDYDKIQPSQSLPEIKADDLAYVLYTSGSTGKPKGVKISHGALINFLLSMKDILGVSSIDDRTVNVTPYTFDICGLEIYLPLLVGSCCVLADNKTAQNGGLLSKLIDEHSVKFVQTTPTKWRLLFDTGWNARSKPTFLCGGESLPTPLVKDLLLHSREAWNVYGPTETTIWSTAYLLKESDSENDAIPVGKPIANTQIYVLDQHQQILPVNCVGELYIGGQGLASGYLEQEALTRERFIVTPPSLKQKSHSSELLYKTGDLAKWLADGNLLCLGRSDQQVKHNGYRIELGDIEAALASHSGIKQVAVTREKIPSTARYDLIAYYVAKNKDNIPTADDLRHHLAKKLPVQLLPNQFCLLETMPVNNSGKIDRKALCIKDFGKQSVAPDTARKSTATEIMLIAIWEQLLGIKACNESNFFGSGGNSLAAIRMAYAIENAFNMECHAQDIFEHAVLSQLALWIDSKTNTSNDLDDKNFKKVARLQAIPLSSAQKRFWFSSKVDTAGTYNAILAWELHGNVNFEKLQTSINRLRKKHEILRTIYQNYSEDIYQIILDYQPETINVEQIRESDLGKIIKAEQQWQFSLEATPPFRVRFLLVGEEYTILLINLHHIIFDETSFNLIIDELSKGYQQATDKGVLQFADYACWEAQHQHKQYHSDTIQFWKNNLSNYKPLSLPSDFTISSNDNVTATIYTFEIDAQLYVAIQPINVP